MTTVTEKVSLILAPFTAIGVIATIVFSSINLKESRDDRRQRDALHAKQVAEKRREIEIIDAPFVIFDSNSAVFYPSTHKIGGRSFNVDKTRTQFIPTLRNFGRSPALEVWVTWIVSEVNGKPYKPLSKEVAITSISDPMSILPGDGTRIYFLPDAFDPKLYKEKNRIGGICEIDYRSVSGKAYHTVQGYVASVKKEGDTNYVEVTFDSIRDKRFDEWRQYQ